MYYALCNNQAVRANHEAINRTSGERHYICPQCRQPVQLVMKGKSRPYFKHYAKAYATTQESQWHRENKWWIAQALKKVGWDTAIEKSLSDGERRADVYVRDVEQEFTIELQSSLINAAEVRQRCSDYQKYNIQIIWLLNNQQTHYRFCPENFQRLIPFMQVHRAIGVYLPYWDTEEKRVYLLNIDGFGRPIRRCVMKIADYLSLFISRHISLPGAHKRLSLPQSKNRTHFQLLQRKTRLLSNPTRAERQLLRLIYQHRVQTDAISLTYFNYDYPCLFVREKLHHVLIFMMLLRRLDVPRAKYQSQLSKWLHFRSTDEELRLYIIAWFNQVWHLSKQVEKQISN